MNKKIAAITVTYNRTRTLVKCLRALTAQSRPVDDIIIVDNHSNPEEQQIIRDLVYELETSSGTSGPRFHTVWLEDNLGGAGGFEAGMIYARDQLAPDYYWLMDDDAYPRTDCLELLLANISSLPDAGCVCPLIYGLDLQAYQAFHHMKVSSLIRHIRPVSPHPETLTQPVRIDANAFVGPLFAREVIGTLGVADGSLFIYGDDTDYIYRVSRRYGVYLIPQAIIEHQDAPTRDVNMSANGWWKEYYGIRNQFFLIRKTHSNMFIRTLGYIAYTGRLVAVMVKSKLKGYHRLRQRIMIRAIRDGLANRRGKTLDPASYLKYLEEKNIT